MDEKVKLDTFEEQMDFLAKDEQEAIDGYERIIAMQTDEHVIEQLRHILEEEIAHKEFLEAVKTDPSFTYEHAEEGTEVEVSLEESKSSIPEKSNLVKALERFDRNGRRAQQGSWSIARGGYDLAFAVYYKDGEVVEGIASWFGGTKLRPVVDEYEGHDTKELMKFIASIYKDCHVEDTQLDEASEDGLSEYRGFYVKKLGDGTFISLYKQKFPTRREDVLDHANTEDELHAMIDKRFHDYKGYDIVETGTHAGSGEWSIWEKDGNELESGIETMLNAEARIDDWTGTEASDLRKRWEGFPNISSCDDADELFDALGEEDLKDIEKELQDYMNSDPDEYAERHFIEDGYPMAVEWFEGTISTEDLIDWYLGLNEDLEPSKKFRHKKTGEVGTVSKDFGNGYVLFVTDGGDKSQVSSDELDEVSAELHGQKDDGIEVPEGLDFSELGSIPEFVANISNGSLKNADGYPYSATFMVSNDFVDSLNSLQKGLLQDKKNGAMFLSLLFKGMQRYTSDGKFSGITVEKILGLPKKYDGKMYELKLGEIAGKPIRIVFFRCPNNIVVFANVLYHQGKSLSNSERSSGNRTYDAVYGKQGN